MNEKLNSKIEYAASLVRSGVGLAYARALYKRAAQGFYLNPNEKFELMILCLRKAGYEIR